MKTEFKLDLKLFIKTKYKILILVNLITIVLVIFLCGLKFKPTEDEKVFIFMSSELSLTKDTKTMLFDICDDYGIRELNAIGYDENDQYFYQTFSTRGYFGSDLFILSKDVISKLEKSYAFKTLDETLTSLGNLYLYDTDNNIIAIGITEEYYVLVNKQREKPNQMILEVLTYLLQNGGEVFEEKGTC